MTSLVSSAKAIPLYLNLQPTPSIDVIQFYRTVQKHLAGRSETHPKFLSWVVQQIDLPFNTHEGYLKALYFISNECQKGVKLKDQTPEGLIDIIFKLYEQVSPDLDEGYRQGRALIMYSEKLPSRDCKNKKEFFDREWEAYFTKQDNKEYQYWLTIKDCIYHHYCDPKAPTVKFSHEDFEFLIKHQFMFCLDVDPDDLEKETIKFTEKLSQKLKEETDPFCIMAFVHCNIVRLHIKDDCNGRVARLLMHWIAHEMGIKPILIQDALAYDRLSLNEQAIEVALRHWSSDQKILFDGMDPQVAKKVDFLVKMAVTNIIPNHPEKKACELQGLLEDLDQAMGE